MTRGYLRFLALALVLVLAEAVFIHGVTKAEVTKEEQTKVAAIMQMEKFIQITLQSLTKMNMYVSSYKQEREDAGCCEEVREQEVNEFSKLEKGFDFAITAIRRLEDALGSFFNHVESYYCAICPPNSDEPCLMSERRCESSECVPRRSFCDGTRNCEDGSDEDTTVCVQPCQDDEYRCQVENRCLPASYWCDGLVDCTHGDDEASCNPAPPSTSYTNTTSKPYFTTASTYHSTPYVDTVTHRSYWAKNMPSNLCEEGQSRCTSEAKCINASSVCNGFSDCSDDSDEQNCTCAHNEFLCQSGKRCINKLYKCDGDDDCLDGSDESECGNCTATQFRCHTGKCIHQSFRCDGDNDCVDNSDEHGCEDAETQQIVCNSNQFMCEAEKRCIREVWVCDGDLDCEDGSDEIGCDDVIKCEVDEFLCGTRNKCVPRRWLCDGQAECPDGSDEVNCTAPVPGTALPPGTAPPPGTATPTGLCEDGKYLCGSGECIYNDWHCDGDPDCKDGSDEQDCELCPTHTCSHTCFPSSTDARGYICACPVGFVLSKDRRTCFPCDSAGPIVEAEKIPSRAE